MIKYTIDEQNYKIIKLTGEIIEEFIQFPTHKVELKPKYFLSENDEKYYISYLFDSFYDAKKF